jgi:hypothetical protein
MIVARRSWVQIFGTISQPRFALQGRLRQGVRMTTSSGAGHQQTAQKTTQQQHQQPQQPIYFGPFDVTNQVRRDLNLDLLRSFRYIL